MLPNRSESGSLAGGFIRTLPGDASPVTALSLPAKVPSNLIMLKATSFKLDKKIGLQLLRFYQELSQNWRSDQELLLPPAKTFSGDISEQEPAGRVLSPGLGHENLQEEVKSVAGD